jgi:hypothetical protein
LLRRPGVAAVLVALAAIGCRGKLPQGWLYVTAVSEEAATVVWTGQGDEELACRGPEGRLADARPTAAPRGVTVARVEGLRPGTLYACRLRRAGQAGRVLRFRTAPNGIRPFRFAAVGDSGDGSPQAAALARRILASRPAFVLHLGDIAYRDSTPQELDRRFFRPYGRLLTRTPFFPTPGNHDLHSKSAFFDTFGPAGGDRSHPHYAFDWAGTHLVSVASGRIATGDGARWLADTLAAARPSQWRIVFLHEPPFVVGPKAVVHGLRATVEPLLEAGAADLVLAGHVHLYARAEPACAYVATAGVLQMISGGGGRNLDPPASGTNFPRVESITHFLRVQVSPRAIDVRAVDATGHVIEHTRRLRGQALACRSGGWPVPREK